MKGLQLTFFTQQDRRHGTLPLGEWLIQEARKLGVPGATLIAAFTARMAARGVHVIPLFTRSTLLGD